MATIRQGYQKKTTESLYTPVKGLTSKKLSLAEPDRMVECQNFVFLQNQVMSSRPGLSFFAYRPNALASDLNVDATAQIYNTSENKSYFVYTCDRSVQYIDTLDLSKTVQTCVMGATTAVFDTSNPKDMAVYKESVYMVEGTSTLFKWDGVSHAMTKTDIPDCTTYGNPVSICQSWGRLFVVTDKNYLRYTAVDTDSVWADRVLMGGQVTASTSVNALVGTSTVFTQVGITGSDLEMGLGVNIVLTNGTTECLLKVASITSTTQMTVTTKPTISGTDLTWYLQGIDYYEPLETGDNYVCKFIRPFANALAVARGSRVNSDKGGGITYLGVDAQQNSNVLAITQRNLTQALNIFPYSLCEYEDNLIFLAESGVFAVPAGSVFNANAIKLENISLGKLENILKNLDIEYARRIRIKSISNDQYNMLLISYVEVEDSGKITKFLGGYRQSEGFEFSKLTHTFELSASSDIEYCQGYGVYNGYPVFISNRYLTKGLFSSEHFYDSIPGDAMTVDSTRVTIDSETVTCDQSYSSNNKKGIYKYFKTGLTSNNLVDWTRIQKLYFITGEATYNLTGSDTYNLMPYTVGSQLNKNYTTTYKKLMTLNKKYVYSVGVLVYTADDTIHTADNTILTADSASEVEEIVVQNSSYYVNARSIPNVGLEFEDTFSTGKLDIYGYGFSGLPSSFK